MRAIVPTSTCPNADIDGQSMPMAVRAPADANFPLLCSMTLPKGAKQITAGGIVLKAPVADPQRILVLGDTGCRIKKDWAQDCSSSTAWPFKGLSKAAADMNPDLVLHLGDFLYRESECPTAIQPGCAGSPHGDNWPTWAADFFSPATPLLEVAPWIVNRGNHEDCSRQGPGFLRLLGPDAYDPNAPCNPRLAPYIVQQGSQRIAVVDNTAASDDHVDEHHVADYTKDYETLARLAGKNGGVWLTSHKPIWAANAPGVPSGNATLIAAVKKNLKLFNAVSLMLAGHIHTFEAINYAGRKVPPQIVAGHGGDLLDDTALDLKGTQFPGNSGVTVDTGLSVHGFGFLMMTKQKTGWLIGLYDSTGAPERQCTFDGKTLTCPPPKKVAAAH